MLLKRIDCRVDASQRAAFDRAQRAWAALADVDGFVGQVGGWTGDGARILGLWRDRASYDAFMAGVHDEITDASRQEQTYIRSAVTLQDLDATHDARWLAALASARAGAPTLIDADSVPIEPAWTVVGRG